LDARAHRGRWVLRIEDLDRPREVPGAADRIVRTLERFGFEWDGDILRQHERREHYADALRSLETRSLTFECSCSRMQLEDELRYPGTCRERAADKGTQTAIRVRVEPGHITFTDRIQGTFRQDVSQAAGDLILRRRDQITAYLLAVVVDDAAQGITHIVRGADLLDNTPRQIYLQRLLGHPEPQYAHVPVLTEPDDAKLAKTRRSVSLSAESPLPQLLSVLSLLGLAFPEEPGSASLEEVWTWAKAEWSVNKVPKRLNLRITESI
jgi:glutamyl-Q tRNA(Asp) synthetase